MSQPVRRKKSPLTLLAAGTVSLLGIITIPPVAAMLARPADMSVAAVPITIAPTGPVCPRQPRQGPRENMCILDADTDYTIVLGHRTGTGGVHFDGGRNITIIGGQITGNVRKTCDTTLPTCRDDEWKDHGITFVGQTGTVHVEGLLIENLTDAIIINAPDAIFEFKRIRIENLHTYQDDFTLGHPDIFTTWSIPRELWINGMTADSDFTGISFFGTANTPGGPRAIHMSNIDIAGNVQDPTLLAAPYGDPADDPGAEQGEKKTPLGIFHTLGEQDETVQSCNNCWVRTGFNANGYRRPMYDWLRTVEGAPPLTIQLIGADGTEFTCVTGDGSCASAPKKLGRTQGDKLMLPATTSQPNWNRVSWYFGTPPTPSGDFVPSGSVGVDYVAPD